MRVKQIRILLIFILLLIVSCQKTQIRTEKDPLSNIRKSLFATIERPNTPMPEFRFKDINGKEISNVVLKDKPFIIQGFTYGCNSCAQEITTLNKIYSQYEPLGLEILSVEIGSNNEDEVRETKQRYNGGNWIWALDTDNLGIKLGMKSLESTYLINKEGNIVYIDHIITDSQLLSEEIAKII